MSITTKEIPDGPRPLSRAELEAKVKEWEELYKGVQPCLIELGEASIKEISELGTKLGEAHARIKQLEAYIRKTQPNYSYAEYK